MCGVLMTQSWYNEMEEWSLVLGTHSHESCQSKSKSQISMPLNEQSGIIYSNNFTNKSYSISLAMTKTICQYGSKCTMDLINRTESMNG